MTKKTNTKVAALAVAIVTPAVMFIKLTNDLREASKRAAWSKSVLDEYTAAYEKLDENSTKEEFIAVANIAMKLDR